MSKFPSENGDRAQESSPDDVKPGVSGDDHGQPPMESRGKEADSWRDAFASTEPGLRKFLARKLPQAADVDDCLQCLVVAMLKNETPIPVAARKAWLYRVAANEAAQWWRKKSTTDRVLEKHADTAYSIDTASHDTTGLDEIETKETLHQVNQAIENLSTDARQVVQMRLRDGMTFQSIADDLRLPLGTVLTRMRRAMQRLRNELAAGDDAED